MLPYVGTIRIKKGNYKKEVAKQILRSAIVATKNHLAYHFINMIPSYQQNIGTLKLSN